MRNRGQRLQRITFNIDFEEQLLTDNKELEGLGFNKYRAFYVLCSMSDDA